MKNFFITSRFILDYLHFLLQWIGETFRCPPGVQKNDISRDVELGRRYVIDPPQSEAPFGSLHTHPPISSTSALLPTLYIPFHMTLFTAALKRTSKQFIQNPIIKVRFPDIPQIIHRIILITSIILETPHPHNANPLNPHVGGNRQ